MASHNFYAPNPDHPMMAPQAQRFGSRSELSDALFSNRMSLVYIGLC